MTEQDARERYRAVVAKAILDSEPTGNWLTLVRKLCTAFGIDIEQLLPKTTVHESER